jgi:formylglycine-generating enzyme required for sulfatase activity
VGGGSGMTGVGGSSIRPSCQDRTLTCGTASEDCCASELVPGGTFSFGVGWFDQPSVATVSSFYLDKFEVTVGRFKAFLAEYDAWRETGHPSAGENTLPGVPDSGWQSEWDDLLPRDSAAFAASIMGCGGRKTLFADAFLPMNCLKWEDAFAFCLWDQARLPTSAEWEYAALGGDQHRRLPWGPEPLTHARAVYNCLGDGIDGCSESYEDILPVGSRPLGAGRWGQHDLEGSMREFVFDYFGSYPPTCNDCALTEGEFRAFRGGTWYNTHNWLEAVTRSDYYNPPGREESEGVRCARRVE